MSKYNKKPKLLLLTAAISLALQTNVSVAQDDEVEVIQVRGIKSSLTKSMDLKKNAASIQDSILAEDLGKFPDQNVAESLQRITGVMISRTNGEGAKVTVRGFGPKFNAVHINERVIATTDKGREFDFQTLPSELIAGADVVKTSRANISEGSLGAYINVSTARPLDNPGFHAAGSVNLKYNDLAEETNPNFSAIVSNTSDDETFGALFGLSISDSTSRIDSFRATHWAAFEADGGDFAPGPFHDVNGNEVIDETVWYPGRAKYSTISEERERTSANLTLEWAPQNNQKHTFDLLYSKLDRQSLSNGIQIPTQRPGFTDVILSENNTVLAATKVASPIDGLFEQEGQKSEQIATGLNSIFYMDEWTFKFDVSYSKADSTPGRNAFVPHYVNPNVDQSVLPGDPGYKPDQHLGLIEGEDYISFDSRNGDVITIDTTIDYADPAAVRAHWNHTSKQELEDEIKAVKFDGSYELDRGIMSSVDFGISYSDREKSVNAFEKRFNCSNEDLPEDEIVVLCGTSVDMSDDLFSINSSADFLSDVSGDFPRDFILINDVDDYIEEIGVLRKEPGWDALLPALSQTVANTEETLALYTQLNLEGELSGYSWSGNVGLRYVDTDTSSSGFGKELLSITGVDGIDGYILYPVYSEDSVLTKSKNYSGVLPSANISVDLGDGYFVKGAAAQVITRPSLDDVGVNRNYQYVRARTSSETGGNPDLNPYEATQLDLSFEYYSDNGNAYSLALFHKEIDTYISTQTEVRPTGFTLDGFGPLDTTITEKLNRDGGSVSGLEIAGLYYFDYLPGFLSGFGVQANYTYTESTDDNADIFEQQNVQAPASGLEGFSENAYNLIAFYDKDGFQARLAYNWRDDFLEFRQGPTIGSNGLPQHVEAYGQTDFSMSYEITENFTVKGEAINLTNENTLGYADVRERVTQVQYAGRRFQIGISATF